MLYWPHTPESSSRSALYLRGNPNQFSGVARVVHGWYSGSPVSTAFRTCLTLGRSVRNGKLAWRWFWTSVWPLTAATLRFVARTQPPRRPENSQFRHAIMMVSDPSSDTHWPNETPNATARFARWLLETRGFSSVHYASSLKQLESVPPNSVAIANYDWLANVLIGSRPFRNVLSETLAARELGIPIWSPLIDLFSVRYATYSSILVAGSGGASIICQNSPDEAARFGLPNLSGVHLWMFPPSERKVWRQAFPWNQREGAAVAFSGDPRREHFFPPLLPKLEKAGYSVIATKKNLSWEEYVKVNKATKIVVTTCWLQDLFLVGPRRYRKLLPEGHITMRVWEAFASRRALVTTDVPALRYLGFAPGRHFVALPEDSDGWSSWQLPPDWVLEEIADRGARHFRSMFEGVANASGHNCE